MTVTSHLKLYRRHRLVAAALSTILAGAVFVAAPAEAQPHSVSATEDVGDHDSAAQEFQDSLTASCEMVGDGVAEIRLAWDEVPSSAPSSDITGYAVRWSQPNSYRLQHNLGTVSATTSTFTHILDIPTAQASWSNDNVGSHNYRVRPVVGGTELDFAARAIVEVKTDDAYLSSYSCEADAAIFPSRFESSPDGASGGAFAELGAYAFSIILLGVIGLASAFAMFKMVPKMFSDGKWQSAGSNDIPGDNARFDADW